MKRYERRVKEYIERNGPSTVDEIHNSLRHLYYIGGRRSLAQQIAKSTHFQKVEEVAIKGEFGRRHALVKWRLKK